MPFPAARVAVPNVGSSRNPRSDSDARIDQEVGGMLRRGQFEYGPLRQSDAPRVQRRNVQGLCAPPTSASTPRQANDRGARQRCIPSLEAAQAAPASVSQSADVPLPPAIQPATVPDRTCLEARATTGDAQSILRDAPGSPRRSQCLLQKVGASERSLASLMLHYLRRRV